MEIIAAFRGQRGIDCNIFCRLVLFCYFAVFAVMPLAYIHVEPRSEIVSIVEEARPPAERFLVVLHEALSLHFKDRVDHACFARGGPPGKIVGALFPEDGRQPAMSAAPETLQSPITVTAAPARGHRSGDGAAPGASRCRCGLSPPSVIPALPE
ncbi:MAG: hypothetical protein M0Z60_08735 [Nitrospiraceae bacterium]|nr:hypothetical protein [Nitrospiraceae bacterium]